MMAKIFIKKVYTFHLEKLMNESCHSLLLEERREENSQGTSVGTLIWTKMAACV